MSQTRKGLKVEIKYTEKSLYKRLFAIFVAIAFFVLLIIVKIFCLTIVDSQVLKTRALSQWMRGLPMSANRGNIKDRNGVVLASSYTTYDLYVRPADMEDSMDMSIYLSHYLNMSQEKIYEKIHGKRLSEIKVATSISKSVVQEILNDYKAIFEDFKKLGGTLDVI